MFFVAVGLSDVKDCSSGVGFDDGVIIDIQSIAGNTGPTVPLRRSSLEARTQHTR